MALAVCRMYKDRRSLNCSLPRSDTIIAAKPGHRCFCRCYRDKVLKHCIFPLGPRLPVIFRCRCRDCFWQKYSGLSGSGSERRLARGNCTFHASARPGPSAFGCTSHPGAVATRLHCSDTIQWFCRCRFRRIRSVHTPAPGEPWSGRSHSGGRVPAGQ